jgi:CBS domain-containing protein
VIASDIMTVGAATVREADPLLKAVELLANHHISALPVLSNDGDLTGIVTEGDFLRHTGFHLATALTKPRDQRRRELQLGLVREVMTRDCVTISPDSSVYDAIAVMDQLGLKRLPVVAGGKLVGILSRSDLLRALIDKK